MEAECHSVLRPYPPMAGRLAAHPASLVDADAAEVVTGPELGVVDVADGDRTVDPGQAVLRRVSDAGSLDPAETGEARLEAVRVTV